MNVESGSVRPFRTAEFGGSRPTVPYAVHPFFCSAANEIEIHQQVQVLVPTGKTDAQVRRTHLEPEVHGAERAPQCAIQECLLAARIVLRARCRSRLCAAGRR